MIQEAMRSNDPSGSKFKRVTTDFPDMEILTNSATTGEIQATYMHMSIWNKSLGKTATDFALAGSLKDPNCGLD